MFKKRLVASLFASLAIVAPASAAVIAPVAVTASNTFPFWNEYKAVNLINGSGLSNGLHDGNYTNMWMTDLGVQSAVLIFDLGSSQALNGVNIWNYNTDFGMGWGLDRGVRDFSLSLSDDGVTYTAVLLGTLAKGTGLPLAAQSFDFIGTARYVRLDVLNNYGDTWSPVGLSEVSFNAVPEPASGAVMAVGLGLAGTAFRRRRAKISRV